MGPFTALWKLLSPLIAVINHRIKSITNSTRHHTTLFTRRNISSSSSQNLKPLEAKALDEGWDHHGLPPGTSSLVYELSRYKRYKVSEYVFKDFQQYCTTDKFNMNLEAGGVYTKAQLDKELTDLETNDLLSYVELQCKANPDGTIGLTAYFRESIYAAATSIRCVSVLDELIPETEKHKYTREQFMIVYNTRVDGCKKCMLSPQVVNEINVMLRGEHTVTGRMLIDIQNKITKWYHDQGYACADVISFGNLNLSEIVRAVREGHITELVFKFQDKDGNLIQSDERLGALMNLLPKQLSAGEVFDLEVARQYLNDANSLGLISTISIQPRLDEKGGIIVDMEFMEF